MDSLKNKLLFAALIIIAVFLVIIKFMFDKNRDLAADLSESLEHISLLEDQNKLSEKVYNTYKKEIDNVKGELESYRQKYQYLEENEDAKIYLDTVIPDSVDASIPK